MSAGWNAIDLLDRSQRKATAVAEDLADRELLFTALAIYLGFVNADDIAGVAGSVAAPDRPEEGRQQWEHHRKARAAISAEQSAVVQALSDELFQKHKGNLLQCFETLKSLSRMPADRKADDIPHPGASEHPTVAQTVKSDDRSARSTAVSHDDDSFIADDLGGASDLAHGQPADGARARGDDISTGTRFRFIRPHAQGGIGRVSVAFDTELQREVALKQIKAERAGDADSRGRFLFEAEVTGRLEHPGIVPVYGLGKDVEGNPFYVMRFVRGQSLEEAIRHFHRPDSDSPRTARTRTLELRSLLDRFADVCHAIAYAHSRGVLHRDLKPANIMLGPFDESLVVDWGLAKRFGRSSGPEPARAETPVEIDHDPNHTSHPASTTGEPTDHQARPGIDDETPMGFSSSTDTQAGTALGTPAFMSPEQAEGRVDELGPSSDVYSLGAVLYTLLCGKTPFEYVWCDVTQLIDRVKVGEFPRPRAVNPEIPRDLEAVCLKAMATRPVDRYASATDLAEEIKRWLADEPVACYREPVLAALARWGRRHKPIVAGAAALLLTAVAALSAGIILVGREQQKTEFQRLAAVQQSVLVSQKAESLRRRDAVSRVNLAYREYLDDNVALADQLLAGCPPDLREWEYEYAHRLGHSELKTFAGSSVDQDVWSVAFSPDGSLLACGSGPWSYVGEGSTGELVVRSVQPDAEVFAIRGLTGAVQAVAFSPDGRQLAVARGFTGKAQGAEVAVFEMPAGRKLWQKPEQGLQIISLAYAPDGRSIASGCGSFTDGGTIGFARLRSAATGEAIGPVITGGPGGVLSVAYSPDGRQLALASRDVVDVYDVSSTTRSLVHRLMGHVNFIYAVAFSPDGQKIASAGWDKTIKIWDRTTGAQVQTLIGHRGFVRSLAFSADGRQLISGSEDKSVRRWDLDGRGEHTSFHGHTGFVHCVAFAPDGALAASGSQDGKVKLWPAAAPEIEVTFRNSAGWVGAVALAPDGRTVASAHSGNIRIWDPHTGEELHRLTSPQTATGHIALVFSPDGTALAASGRGSSVNLWDTTTWTTRRVLDNQSSPAGDADFSPDGRLLATACSDGTLRIWDVSSGSPVRTVHAHEKAASTVAFAPDGRTLASAADEEPTAKVWDTTSGTCVASYSGHKKGVRDLAFSPDGHTIASVGGDYRGPNAAEVKLWDVATGREIHSLIGHTSLVTAVAFFPGGRRLATASDDRTIKLWDTESFENVFTLRGHTSGVLCLDISGDGREIISGSIDYSARTWSAATPALELAAEISIRRAAVERVQSLLGRHLLKPEVIAALRADPSLTPRLRAAAIEIAERRTENASGLYQAGWLAVLRPGGQPDDYRMAARRLEAACQVVADDPDRYAQYRRALALACYRTGEPARAIQIIDQLATLKQPPAQTSPSPDVGPLDLAVTAMSRGRLGDTSRARAALDQLRKVSQLDHWAHDQETQVLLHEAEAVVGSPP
jgi:WD40 repeat protein/serine/threonine protein kinase